MQAPKSEVFHLLIINPISLKQGSQGKMQLRNGVYEEDGRFRNQAHAFMVHG